MTKRRKILAAVLIFLLLGIGGWFYHVHEQDLAQAASHELKLSGNVDVREISLSFRQSDRIAALLVDAGDTVKKGQVLARLDNSELLLTRSNAAAKAAAVQIQGVERNRLGAGACVKMRGSISDVKAAMEVAIRTAEPIAKVVSHTVIASPSEETETAIAMTITK